MRHGTATLQNPSAHPHSESPHTNSHADNFAQFGKPECGGVGDDGDDDDDDDDGPNDLLQAQLAPELAALGAVLGNAGTLAVELIVLGACKLLGLLGAVVAAGCAGGGAGKGHARRGAGDHALGKHGDGWGVERRAIDACCCRKAVVDESRHCC